MFVKYRTALLTTLFGAFVGLCLVLVYFLIEKYDIQTWIINTLPNGNVGIFYLFIILAIGTAIGLPRQIAAFCAGFMLDIFTGALLATTATLIGCWLSLSFAKKFFAKTVERKYPKQLKSLADFFEDQTLLKVMIIRFIPAGSNFLTNIIAGVAKVPLPPYLIGSAIGFIPQMTIFAMMGNGVRLGDNVQLLMSIGLFIIALCLSVYVYKHSPHKPS